eukprot:4558977-Pleurochrysis_carterae.AAC.2
MRWTGAAGGAVEVTIRRSPFSPPEPQLLSALLAGSAGNDGLGGAGAGREAGRGGIGHARGHPPRLSPPSYVCARPPRSTRRSSCAWRRALQRWYLWRAERFERWGWHGSQC